MRYLAFGAGLGMGWAAWRNAPPVIHAESSVFAVVCLLVVLGLFFGRRQKVGSIAVARAEARATAAAVAQGGSVNIILPQGPAAGAGLEGLDSLPWIDPTPAAVDVSAVQDLAAELVEDGNGAWGGGGAPAPAPPQGRTP